MSWVKLLGGWSFALDQLRNSRGGRHACRKMEGRVAGACVCHTHTNAPGVGAAVVAANRRVVPGSGRVGQESEAAACCKL